MIKECISSHPDDSRYGVSRPQIKKFVEETYKLEIGNAQVTQLSKAIAVGAEKGIFSLPKGPSGRVKLAPKAVKAGDDAKENKPTSKTSKTAPNTKTASKPATRPGSKPKTVTAKPTTTTKSSAAARQRRKLRRPLKHLLPRQPRNPLDLQSPRNLRPSHPQRRRRRWLPRRRMLARRPLQRRKLNLLAERPLRRLPRGELLRARQPRLRRQIRKRIPSLRRLRKRLE